jgi:hypothetical protein
MPLILPSLFAADAYDPDDTEDTPRKSSYLSKKDLKWFVLGIGLFMGLMYPIYRSFERQSQEHKCKQNMAAIYKATSQYMLENDDRYPPAYATGEGTDAPYLEKGRPYSWANLPAIDGGLNPRASFTCPTASADEITSTQGLGKSAKLTYGMFAALGGIASAEVETPSSTILIAETSNHGSQGSYNPKPFITQDGTEVQNDGFLISFDDSNSIYSGKARAMTRLAFRDTKEGEFRLEKPSRHDGGIYFVTADGSLRKLGPPSAMIKYAKVADGQEASDLWAVPSRSLVRPDN